MSTDHENAVIKKVDSILVSDPEMSKWISTYAKLLNEGHFKSSYVDIFIQKFERFKKFTIYDAYAFMLLHNAVWTGNVAMVEVGVGGSPRRDSNISGNQEILDSLRNEELIAHHSNIECRFEAGFMPERGRNADGDGYFKWIDPAVVAPFEQHAP